ncbi:MAG: hypothetical protein FWF73_00485, partial [Spirochaetes bacterium]|nr:hypothetical protein [Spirochaetota bacterium]
MKKILVVLMALFFATGAFAQNAGAKFDYNLWGLAYGAAGSWGSDAKWDYQHIRVRPMFTAGNENIKGVVRLQIDEGYGGNDSPGPLSSAADDAAGPFARNKAVKVQYAYLQASNLFMQGLSFTTGIAPYDYPLIADTELALTGVNYDFGMGNVTLAYAKVNEANRYEKFGSKDNEDVQAYIIDATIKTGVVDIRPALFFINAGKEYMLVSTYNKFKVYMGALNANADMGMFGFDATFAYLKASGKDPAGVLDKLDTSGYGVDLNINIKPDKGMEIGVFGTYTSGT